MAVHYQDSQFGNLHCMSAIVLVREHKGRMGKRDCVRERVLHAEDARVFTASACVLFGGNYSFCSRSLTELTSAVVAPSKGGVPLRSMKAMTPMDQQSHFSS